MAPPTDAHGGSPAVRGALTVGVRTDEAVFDDLAPSWDRLLETADDAHPFLSRAWAQAWWEAFGHGPTASASRSRLHVVTVHRGQELVGLYPLLSLRVGVGEVSIRMLVGIGQENADYGGALVARGDAEAMEALVTHLRQEVRVGRTVLNLTRLAEGNVFLEQLRSKVDPGQLSLRSIEEDPYPRLDLRAFSDPMREVRRLERRNDVLRRSRRLAETGEVAWIAHHPDPAGTGLEEFFRVHDLRWRGQSGTGPFTSEPGRRFLAAVTRALDAAGMVRLSLLTIDRVAIGGRYGTVFDGWYQGMKSAWDPRYAPVAPGHLMVGRLLEDAVAEGLEGFDFLRGGGHHKEVWANTSRSVGYWTLGRNDRLAASDQRLLWTAMRLRYRWRDRPRVI